MRHTPSLERVRFERLDGTIVQPFEDCGLKLNGWDIPLPKPQLFNVDIDGRNGSLDMTEWAGMVFYEDRTIKINLRGYRKGVRLQKLYAMMGQRVKVTFSFDPDYYYQGRITDMTPKESRAVVDVTMTIVCEPYKLRHRVTVVTQEIALADTEYEMSLASALMPVYPYFEADAPSTVVYEDVEYSVGNTPIQIPSLVLTTEEKQLIVMSETDSNELRVYFRDGEM